ncbi:MAG: sialate O-acetylesterase [Thermoguttaceae bacterium]|jgi:sialate O-acetylesterase
MRNNSPYRYVRVCLKSVVFLLTVTCFAFETQASVKLPRIFGNDMILQRDVETPIWGWASPGERVTVDICEQRQSVVADETGKWSVELEPQPAGGPFEMTVSASNTIKFTDVYFGDVWICAGQSNVSFPLKRSQDAKSTIETANYPRFRFITVRSTSADEPQNNISGKWEVCSPKTTPDLSAIAYYFGQYLQTELSVPIGVIVVASSNSTCEAWVEREKLAKTQSLAPLIEEERLAKATSTQRAGAVFNGMISPICPYAIKGVVMYQGESNASRAYQYRSLFKQLILSWREKWGDQTFPFIYVQLPNFMASRDEPSSSAWAELREAQHLALTLPNTYEVVTIDVGDANDLQPKNKKTVGVRLANVALAKVYDKDAPWTGPEFKSAEIVDDKIIITFDHAEGGLVASENSQSDGTTLFGFAIAGSDRKFYWADAEIFEENKVILTSPDVPRPVAARYAWADNPICNLTNTVGLPASLFRTDDWPGVTHDAR